MTQPREGSVVAAFGWMLVLSIILGIVLPTIGPFIAGLVGGARAGSVKNALLAAMLPAILTGIIVALLSTLLIRLANYRCRVWPFGRRHHCPEHCGTPGWSLDRRAYLRMK
jgi:cation transporter-like permease